MEMTRPERLEHRKATIDRRIKKLLEVGRRLYVICHPETYRVIYVTTSAATTRAAISVGLGFYHYIIPVRRFDPSFASAAEPWMYIIYDRRIIHEPTELVNVDEYKLMAEKCYAFETVFSNITLRHETLVIPEMPLQTMIYEKKVEQARAVLNGETDINKIYHVHETATMKKIDIEQAAREIIFLNEETHLTLFKIEHLRLKYMRLISDAQSLQEVHEIIVDYDREF